MGMERRALIILAMALAIVARPARAAPAPGIALASDAASSPRVVAVDLVLPPGDDAVAARDLLAVAPGDPLSSRALRRTVQRLFQTGRYRNVVVRATPAAAPPDGSGDWVRLTVEALPVRRLERLTIRTDAPDVLDASALRAAARLPEGEPVDDADLEAAAARVRAALARRGRREARVDAAAAGEAAVTASLEAHAGPPTRVSALRLSGDPGAPAESLTRRLRTRPGAVLDEEALAADLRDLRAGLRAAGYRRARVGAPEVRARDGHAEVEIPVNAGPHVAFVFRGNAAFDAAELERQLGLEEDQPVDAPAVDAAVDRLRGFYRSRGFAAAQIDAEEVRRGAAVAIVLHVREGARYRLGEIRFQGAEAHDQAWLRARLLDELQAEGVAPATEAADAARALLLSIPGARPPPEPPPGLPATEFFDEEAWERAAERIVEGQRAAGYLEAAQLGTSASLDAARGVVDVTVRLREGPLTRVESISFEGNQAVSVAELAREARLAPGDALAFDRVEETRAAILRLYLARGHAYARVEAREEPDAGGQLGAVRFRVEEGPRVRIGRVVVTGNRRTRDGVVREALDVREGAVFDPEAVARSQAALLRLGVFRSVNLRLQEPESIQEVKDLEVELAERPYATLTQSLGFSIANGPRAMLEYSRPNLLGRAVELTARGKVNYLVDLGDLGPDISGKKSSDRLEGRTDVGLRSSRLRILPVPASAHADLIGEILHRRAYDLRRVSGVVGLDAGVTERVGASLQYEVEVDDIRRTNVVGVLTQADLERLRFDEGVTTLHALRPSFTLDFRDNAAHPHRGWFAAGTAELEHSLGASVAGEPDRRSLFGILPASDVHTSLVKVSGTLSGYVPLGGATVVALSLRGGRVIPLDGRSRTIVPRRFFLGGASSMRGYGEEEMIQQDLRAALASEARLCATSFTGVGCTERGRRIAAGQRPVSEGGEAYLLAKAELRVALTRTVEAGLFVDLGNLWLDPNQYRLLDLRTNAGVGARFVTPIGPAALDLGFNVEPDDRINERLLALHFTIGLF
jgi:outer membrane protein insertion porin family